MSGGDTDLQGTIANATAGGLGGATLHEGGKVIKEGTKLVGKISDNVKTNIEKAKYINELKKNPDNWVYETETKPTGKMRGLGLSQTPEMKTETKRVFSPFVDVDNMKSGAYKERISKTDYKELGDKKNEVEIWKPNHELGESGKLKQGSLYGNVSANGVVNQGGRARPLLVDKSKYTKNGNVYDNFVSQHKQNGLIEKSPEEWTGNSVEDAMKHLNMTNGQIKIKSPIEEISIYKSHLEHLITDNDVKGNTSRKKYLNRTIRTIQEPNIITKRGQYHNYIKLFDDSKIKPHLQIVKVKPDGNFYVTNFRPTKQQIKSQIIEGQIIYDLSSLPNTQSVDTNIITDNSETFKGGVEESNITPLENSEKINNNEEKGVDNERQIDRRTNQRTNRENSEKLPTTLQMDKTMVSEQSKRLDTNNQGTIRPNRSERTTDNVTIGNERLNNESNISPEDKELVEKEYNNTRAKGKNIDELVKEFEEDTKNLYGGDKNKLSDINSDDVHNFNFSENKPNEELKELHQITKNGATFDDLINFDKGFKVLKEKFKDFKDYKIESDTKLNGQGVHKGRNKKIAINTSRINTVQEYIEVLAHELKHAEQYKNYLEALKVPEKLRTDKQNSDIRLWKECIRVNNDFQKLCYREKDIANDYFSMKVQQYSIEQIDNYICNKYPNKQAFYKRFKNAYNEYKNDILEKEARNAKKEIREGIEYARQRGKLDGTRIERRSTLRGTVSNSNVWIRGRRQTGLFAFEENPTRQEINKATTLSNSDSAVQRVAKNEVRKWYGEIEKDRYDVNKNLSAFVKHTDRVAKDLSKKLGFKVNGKMVREIMPFLRERTEFPKKLDRKDLRKLYNALSSQDKVNIRSEADKISDKHLLILLITIFFIQIGAAFFCSFQLFFVSIFCNQSMITIQQNIRNFQTSIFSRLCILRIFQQSIFKTILFH